MKLLDYCKKKSKIIIYGAGVFGRTVRCFLAENSVDIMCFAITGVSNRRTLLEKEILTISNIQYIHEEGVGVLVCGNSAIVPSMIDLLIELDVKDYYKVDEEEIDEIDKKTTYSHRYKDNRKYVLLYHRVFNSDNDIWNLNTTQEAFKQQLQFLASEYNIVRYEDVEWESDIEQVAITVDDGYIDSYTNIMPICSELCIPVTIFVCAGNIGKKSEFWWDVIDRAVLTNPACPDSIIWRGKKIELETRTQKENACWNIWDEIIRVDVDLRNEMLEELIKVSHDLGDNRMNYRTINERELVELDKSPWVTIGAHTLTHTRLTSESDEQIKKEMVMSKKKLEEILGHDVNIMSFPFGCENDYDERAIEMAKEAGFVKVAAVKTKYHDERILPFNHPRLSICAHNSGEDAIRIIKRMMAIYG